jgi:hypothetical protein
MTAVMWQELNSSSMAVSRKFSSRQSQNLRPANPGTVAIFWGIR